MATQIVLARPHTSVDHGMRRASQTLGAKMQQLMVSPRVRAHPNAVLALFVITGAALGAGNLTLDGCARLRDSLIDAPLRAPAQWVSHHVGAGAAVPLALMCDGVALPVSVACAMVAACVGVAAGLVTGVGVLPALLFLPKNVRQSVADGLCSYITLQQRFAAVERALRGAGNDVFEVPVPERPGPLRLALDRLQAQLEALSPQGPVETAQEPSHAHFQFIRQVLVSHPTTSTRLGLPPPPSVSRLQPVQELLASHISFFSRPASKVPEVRS